MVEKQISGQGGEGEVSRGKVERFLSTLTSTGKIFDGAANINRMYVGQDGGKYLYREPKERTRVTEELTKWYSGIGFTGQFRYLSNAEQAQKMSEMQNLGLKTVAPVVSEGEQMILPFIEGETLLSYIKDGKHNVVPAVVDHLLSAHRQGVVFGDRWTPNTIVTPKEDFVEIDFDIELTGPNTKEFELSQLLYSLVVYTSSREAMMGVIKEYLPKRKNALQAYDTSVLAGFLRGPARYLDGQIFEGSIHNIGDEVGEIVSMVA